MTENLTLRGPLGWSIASIIVIILFCAYAITTVASPLMNQRAVSTPTTSKTDQLVQKYNQQIAVDIARFNGRSAFFTPIQIPVYREPPPTPKIDPTPAPEEKIVDLGPPPPPPTYMGPSLIAVMGEEAWFRGTGSDSVIRLKVGEEQDGLKVIKTSPPSIVTVEHRGGEYPIDLFTNDEPFFRQDAPPVMSDNFLEEVES
jgi:hypothetical protein